VAHSFCAISPLTTATSHVSPGHRCHAARRLASQYGPCTALHARHHDARKVGKQYATDTAVTSNATTKTRMEAVSVLALGALYWMETKL